MKFGPNMVNGGRAASIETRHMDASNKKQDPLLLSYGLTLLPAWISTHTHYKLWDDTTYPFLNFNGATVEV